MRTFKALFNEKMSNRAFCRYYEEECHVCPFTMRIFATLETSDVPLDRLAVELNVDLQALLDLQVADYCDPSLVVRMCRLLGQAPPPACPRLR